MKKVYNLLGLEILQRVVQTIQLDIHNRMLIWQLHNQREIHNGISS